MIAAPPRRGVLLVPGEAADLDGLDRGHMTEKREDTLRITNQFP